MIVWITHAKVGHRQTPSTKKAQSTRIVLFFSDHPSIKPIFVTT